VQQSDGIFLLLQYIGFLQPSDLHPGHNNTQHTEALSLLSEAQFCDGIAKLMSVNAVCLPSELLELRSKRLLLFFDSDSPTVVEGLPGTPQNLETGASSSSASSASFSPSYKLPPSLRGAISPPRPLLPPSTPLGGGVFFSHLSASSLSFLHPGPPLPPTPRGAGTAEKRSQVAFFGDFFRSPTSCTYRLGVEDPVFQPGNWFLAAGRNFMASWTSPEPSNFSAEHLSSQSMGNKLDEIMRQSPESNIAKEVVGKSGSRWAVPLLVSGLLVGQGVSLPSRIRVVDEGLRSGECSAHRQGAGPPRR